MTPCILKGAHLGLAHPMLDLGEGLLDRVEVGRIGRQEPEPGTGGLDGLANGCGLVAAEIVHDDDIARFQHRHELLLDIGAEALTIDRPVEHARRRQPVAAQCGQEGERAPVTMRGKTTQAFALLPPATQRRHVGLDPCLINEHQPPGIEIRLKRPPAPSPPGYVGTSMLKGEQCFF